MKKLVLLIIILIVSSCQGQDCETLPQTFNTYKEALTSISRASFNFSEDVDTSKSSWIKGANFYSCDGVNGFLIIETKSKKYIYKDAPIKLWNNFKEASSFGKFYSKYIRDKFQLVI